MAATLAATLLVLTGCASGPAGPADAEAEPAAGAGRTLTGFVAADDTGRFLTGAVTWDWWAPMRACDVVLDVPVNTPVSARNGSRVTVDEVAVAGRVLDHRVQRPVRGDRGSRVVAALPACVPAGAPLEVSVRFRAEAGSGGNERTGHASAVTWWGSVIPQPAYATRDGWVRQKPVTTKGESQVQEEFAVRRLEVLTSASARVAGPGTVRRGTVSGGRVAWRVSAPAVRDVALVVGAFVDAAAGPVGCRVRAVVPRRDGLRAARRLAASGAAALRTLSERFGFCPYETTTVAAVQPGYGGMEFPGVVVVARHDPRAAPRLVAHEMGHQFFYAHVGSDQGREPWLDEAFATYAEALVNPATAADLRRRHYPTAVIGRLGAPMAYWDRHPDLYSTGVYAQGATALLRARDTTGPRVFDGAVRDWIAACGGRVCTAATLRTVLAEAAPAALGPLEAAGAWPERN